MVLIQNGLQRYKLFSEKQCYQLKLFESEEKRLILSDSAGYPKAKGIAFPAKSENTQARQTPKKTAGPV
jgi:hypothetical protein